MRYVLKKYIIYLRIGMHHKFNQMFQLNITHLQWEESTREQD